MSGGKARATFIGALGGGGTGLASLGNTLVSAVYSGDFFAPSQMTVAE
jgi:hypothetical protein